MNEKAVGPLVDSGLIRRIKVENVQLSAYREPTTGITWNSDYQTHSAPHVMLTPDGVEHARAIGIEGVDFDELAGEVASMNTEFGK